MPGTALFISYHFPPENVIGAARPARFVRYLRDFGWSCRVITAAPAGADRAQPFVHVVQDLTRNLWEEPRDDRGNARWHRRIAELFARKAFFPGAVGLGWARDALLLAESLDRQLCFTPRVVISTYPPLCSHLAAKATARRRQIPWVADFRDPFFQGKARGVPVTALLTARALESRFFRDASAVVVNTEPMAQMYRARYPRSANKISVIWNGFDPKDDLGALKIPAREVRVFRHLGALYHGRNPITIIESLQRLRDRKQLSALNFRLELIGPNNSRPNEQAVIDAAAKAGWVSICPMMIPKSEANELMQTADGLLLLQPHTDVLVPGKLFEYIRIGRPILSLAPRNSPIEWILDRSGVPQVSVYPDDPPAEVDRKVLAFLGMPPDPSDPLPWFIENFNAEFQARQLAEILDRVTGSQAGGAAFGKD